MAFAVIADSPRIIVETETGSAISYERMIANGIDG